jgi:hydrogenase expression/formation protein HypC
MCLAIPAKVVALETAGVDALPSHATIDLEGVRRKVSVALLPDVKVGDWVIVHVGFALSKLDEDEAQRTLALAAAARGDAVGEAE